MKIQNSFFSKIRKALAPQWVGRALVLLAFISGLGVGALFTAGKLSWLNASATPVAATDEATDLAAEGTDNATIEDDSAELADNSAVTSSDDEDDSDDVADAEELEIPDSLRLETNTDPFVASVLGPIANVEGLLAGEAAPVAKTLVFDRDAVLLDHSTRIGEDFHVPPELKDRVGFWFDVYSKYDSNHRIIHNSMYPWIVYKVVDVSYIVDSDVPAHLWMRRMKADLLVKKEALQIRATLSRLAHRKTFNKLNEQEQALADQLAPLGGNLRRQAMLALHSVRVQTGQKDFFTSGLEVSNRYLSQMEKIFKAHKMPVELTRIPFVESSFNKKATSKVGASGIWQFMNGTGRKYMMVDGAIDERVSPYKATEAAARLLKENHLILYHSWPLAVTAWNHGPTGLRKAISHAGSKDLGKIIARYHSRSFDFASSNFYSEFLAALHAERYSDEIFGNIEREPYVELEVVKLARSVRFSELLKVSGLSRDEFLSSNPELANVAKKNLLLPRGFRLHIPESALENLQSLFAVYREHPSLMMPKTST